MENNNNNNSVNTVLSFGAGIALWLLCVVVVIAGVLSAAVPAFGATIPVYANGSKTVAVPYSNQISVFTTGTAKVYKKAGFPNIPGGWTLLQTVTNREYSSSVFTSNTSIRIDADQEGAWYSVDATADVIRAGPSVATKSQRAPVAKTVATTLTVYDLLSGLVTGTHTAGATAAYTLPTGSAMDASADSLSAGVGASFEWTLINLSDATADTITVTANTGHTVVGAMVVPSKNATTGGLYGSSGTFLTRKTAANTWITYRK